MNMYLTQWKMNDIHNNGSINKEDVDNIIQYINMSLQNIKSL